MWLVLVMIYVSATIAAGALASTATDNSIAIIGSGLIWPYWVGRRLWRDAVKLFRKGE